MTHKIPFYKDTFVLGTSSPCRASLGSSLLPRRESAFVSLGLALLSRASLVAEGLGDGSCFVLFSSFGACFSSTAGVLRPREVSGLVGRFLSLGGLSAPRRGHPPECFS